MKKNTLILSLLAPLAAMYAQDLSTVQNAIDLYGNPIKVGNAKFSSMAGSNGALGGDATSMLTNPAGLGVAITDHLSITASQNMMNNASTFAGKTIHSKLNHFDLSNANAVFVLPTDANAKLKFLNFGINYSSKKINTDVLTNGMNSIALNQDTTSGADIALFDGHNYSRTGTQSELNLGLGANYDNNIYFGASLNMHSLSIEQWDQARFHLQNSNKSIFYNNQYTPYQEESTGISGNFGIIGKVSKELRLGLALETPVFWSMERVYNYNGMSGTQIRSEDRSEDRKMRSPMKTTLSAAFVPNKNLAFNVDYTLGLTQPRYSEYGPAEKQLNDFFRKNGANASQLRAGVEYRVDAWRFRGGYAYTGSGLKGMSVKQYQPNNMITQANTSYVLQGAKKQFGLGIGYDIASFSIDLGYQNITQQYQNVFLGGEYWESTLEGNSAFTTHEINPQANGVSEVKQSLNNFYLSLGFRF